MWPEGHKLRQLGGPFKINLRVFVGWESFLMSGKKDSVDREPKLGPFVLNCVEFKSSFHLFSSASCVLLLCLSLFGGYISSLNVNNKSLYVNVYKLNEYKDQ